MPWQDVTLQWPDNIEDIYTDVHAMQSSMEGELNQAATRLSAIPSPPISTSPLASANSGALALYQQLHNVLNNVIHQVIAHPWLEGDIHGTLSAPNALTYLAESFDDNTFDSNKLDGNRLDALCVLLSAKSLSQLLEYITALSNILPLAELLALKRRAHHILQLDNTQFTIPPQAKKIQWHRGQITHIPTVTHTIKPLSSMVTVSAAAESETNPIDYLNGLIDKKKNRITALNNAYQHAKSVFNNSQTNALPLSGSVSEIKNTILSTPGTGHDYPYCVGILFLAQENQLSLLQELFSAA